MSSHGSSSHGSSTDPSNVPAGWYPDPTMANTQRYWDGAQWTHHVQPISDPTAQPQPDPTQQYQPPPDPTQHHQSQQYPGRQLQDHVAPQHFPAPGPGPIVPQKSGMSTGVKVLIGIGVLSLLTLGGCAALIAVVSSSIDQSQLIEDGFTEDGFADTVAEMTADEAAELGTDSAAIAGDDTGGNTDGVSLPFDQPVDVVWNTFGDAEGSAWATTVGPPRDITDEVLSENEFNNPPPDGVRFAGFDVELTLLDASKEPLAPGFNFTWEVLGGATAAVYQWDTVDTDSFGCGVVGQAFDDFAEVFAGGTLSGTVCIPIPEEDLSHPDTRVALHFIDDSRTIFGN